MRKPIHKRPTWKRPPSFSDNEMNAQAVAPQYPSVTIKADTPTGTMFVTILEDEEGKPFKIFIHVGKTGTDAEAWASSLAATINSALVNGAGINDIIEEISQQTSDRATPNGDFTIRSGPDGLVYALQIYRKAKYKELRNALDGGGTGRRQASLDY